MRICWFGIYDGKYSRNAILLKGLAKNGVTVIECNAAWNDKMRYIKLFKNLLSLRGAFDCVYAAYPATVPVILAKIISRKRVVMDAFYSMFDSVVNDRKEITRFHPRAVKLLIIDWVSIMLADQVITDTEEHKKYWSTWWLVNPDKIKTIYLGSDTDTFFPQKHKKPFGETFLVHFHGKFIPLQGVPKIIETARILKDDATIRFRLVGSGRESDAVNHLIQKYALGNIECIDRVSTQALNDFMSEADLVLGIFGDTAKAQRVIPNKVYEGLAAGRAVVTADTPAMREIIKNDEVLIIENSPEALAGAILRLKADSVLRNKYAQSGHELFLKKFTPQLVAISLLDFLKKTHEGKD